MNNYQPRGYFASYFRCLHKLLAGEANEPAGEGEREHPLSIPFVMPRVVGGGSRKENALKSARVLEAKKLVISLFGAM